MQIRLARESDTLKNRTFSAHQKNKKTGGRVAAAPGVSGGSNWVSQLLSIQDAGQTLERVDRVHTEQGLVEVCTTSRVAVGLTSMRSQAPLQALVDRC